MRKTTFIYALIDPRDGQVKYIGKSNNPLQRLVNHYHDKNPNKKLNWILHLRDLGLKPELLILDEVPFEKWKWWESFYYQLMRTWSYELKNDEDPEHGGGGSYLTKEMREKLSQAFKGKTFEERHGVERAKEIKAKIAITKKNKSKEEREASALKRKESLRLHPEKKLAANKRASEFRKGKPLQQILKNISVEDRNKKVGEGLKASKKWREGIKNRDNSGSKNPRYLGTVYQYSRDKTVLINTWPSLREIDGYENNANISSVCNGNLKSAYGYFWSREKFDL
jgi:hypothetical protein